MEDQNHETYRMMIMNIEGNYLSMASVTLYREVLDINYYLDVYNFRMPMPPRFLKSYPIFLTKFILLTCF